MMSCEEAWLLLSFMQGITPEVIAMPGYVPVAGEDQTFPVGATGEAVRFTIRREKCPNRRGVERIIEASGCATLTFDEFVEKAGQGEFAGAWIVGGYPERNWVPKELASAAGKIEFLVVQDIFDNKLVAGASVVLPSCAFVEREGCFVNQAGKVQPFRPAVAPPDGCRRDGQYLYELAGHQGLYNAGHVRELMAATMSEFAEVADAPPAPAHQH